MPLCVVVVVVARLLRQQHTLDGYGSLQELLDQELLYVAEQVQRAPDNESAWNYVWGLFSLPGCPQHEMGRQDKVRAALCARTHCCRGETAGLRGVSCLFLLPVAVVCASS